MDDGFDQLIAGSKKISAGIDQINTGVQALAEQSKTGIDKVKTATSQLASNNEALNEGMASLQTGTQTVANQSDSFNQMADGLKSMNMQYKEYAGNNPDMDVTTRYVFRTKTSE